MIIEPHDSGDVTGTQVKKRVNADYLDFDTDSDWRRKCQKCGRSFAGDCMVRFRSGVPPMPVVGCSTIYVPALTVKSFHVRVLVSTLYIIKALPFFALQYYRRLLPPTEPAS